MCAVNSQNRANLLLCALIIQARLFIRTFHIDDAVLHALGLIGFYLRARKIRDRATANQRHGFLEARHQYGMFWVNSQMTRL